MTSPADLAFDAARRVRKRSMDGSTFSTSEVRELANAVRKFDPTDPFAQVATSYVEKVKTLSVRGNRIPSFVSNPPKKYTDDQSIADGLDYVEDAAMRGGNSATLGPEVGRLYEATKIQGTPHRALLAARTLIVDRLVHDRIPRRISKCAMVKAVLVAGLVIGSVILFRSYSPMISFPKFESIRLPSIVNENSIVNFLSKINQFMDGFR